MGAILLSPLYLLLNIYLAGRLLAWFHTLNSFLGRPWFAIPFAACYALVALTPLSGAFAQGKLKILTKRISNYWLGTLMYLLIFLLTADLTRIVFCLLQHRSVFAPFDPEVYRITGGLVIGATLLLSVYGIRQAHKVKKTVYEVQIDKPCALPSLRIALAADLHLGYSIGLRHIRKIRDLIQDMHPDLVVYAGDLFDNEFAAVSQPKKAASILKSIKSTYGSYACWGNHDIEEVILAGFTFNSGGEKNSSPQMHQFLRKADIRLLEDDTLLIGNAFYLTGRLDASCKEKSGTIRLAPSELFAGLDTSRPLIVIDHQPSQLRELALAGADLALSGHTHDGQIFPGNLTTRIGWMNSCGKLILGQMTSIVTSGAGFWGPAMRIGTHNEVVEIHVTFRKPEN